MNHKLDEIGLALGNARVELSNLIIEFKRTEDDKLKYSTDNYIKICHKHFIKIAIASIEVHDLDNKWHDEEYKEFMGHEPDDTINPDHDGIEEDHDSLQNGMRW